MPRCGCASGGCACVGDLVTITGTGTSEDPFVAAQSGTTVAHGMLTLGPPVYSNADGSYVSVVFPLISDLSIYDAAGEVVSTDSMTIDGGGLVSLGPGIWTVTVEAVAQGDATGLGQIGFASYIQLNAPAAANGNAFMTTTYQHVVGVGDTWPLGLTVGFQGSVWDFTACSVTLVKLA